MNTLYLNIICMQNKSMQMYDQEEDARESNLKRHMRFVASDRIASLPYEQEVVLDMFKTSSTK